MAKDKSESDLEATFLAQWKVSFPKFPIQQQVVFHPKYKFRFDFAVTQYQMAIEIQGFGTGHTSYTGMQRDYFKHNEANRLGWVILYFMSTHLIPTKIGATMNYIELFMKEKYGYVGTDNLRKREPNLFESKLDKIRRRYD